MKSHHLYIIVGLILLIAGALIFALRPPQKEPVYGGKRLSQWLDELLPKVVGGLVDMPSTEPARVAVGQIGTNALPLLLRTLHEKDSRFKSKLMEWASMQPLIRFHFTPANVRRAAVVEAFRELGIYARPAIPELTVLLNQPETAEDASTCLGVIGSRDGGPAVTSLMNALTNAHIAVRASAVNGLGMVGEYAHPAIAQLIGTLQDTNEVIRAFAAGALGQIRGEPQKCVPALLQNLNDKSPFVRSHTLSGLGGFRTRAQAAVPGVLEAMKDTNPIVRMVATDAIQKIDPEGTVRAGIR